MPKDRPCFNGLGNPSTGRGIEEEPSRLMSCSMCQRCPSQKVPRRFALGLGDLMLERRVPAH